METTANLRGAIDQAYEAFSRIPRPRHLDAAPTRDGEQILHTLTSAPLRELTAEQIGPYSGHAITTLGSERDYRHFLPRILELAIHNPSWLGLMPPVIANTVRTCEWNAWPNEQSNAVLCVFEAAFEWAIESHPNDTSSAPDWLCGMARLEIPVEPLLTSWRQAASSNAALQLASFMRTVLMRKMRADGSMSGGFWDSVDVSSRRVIGAWLKSPDSHHQLSDSLDKIPSDDRWLVEYALLQHAAF